MAEKYRLQVLLTVKQRMKRRAEVKLARALKTLSEEKEKLKKLEGELEEIQECWRVARREMKEKLTGGALIGKGNVHVNYLRRLEEEEKSKKEDIEDQHQAIEAAEEAVAKARREYLDAVRELDVMRKHKELWEKRVKGELSRKEARRLNELGQTIHQLRRWRGEKTVFEVT